MKATIGTDLQGVCTKMQPQVNARIIPIENGGLRADFYQGLQVSINNVIESLVGDSTHKEDVFNILGLNLYSYRAQGDKNEIARCMKEAFNFDLGCAFNVTRDLEKVSQSSNAKINLVVGRYALPAAKQMEKQYGIPYIECNFYGYQGTLETLKKISEVLNKEINPKLIEQIKESILTTQRYRMLGRMLSEMKPSISAFGDIDKLQGIDAIAKEIGFAVSNKCCTHSLKRSVKESFNVITTNTEAKRLEIISSLHHQLVFADDITLTLLDETNTALAYSAPIIYKSQRCTHISFMGLRGMDYILEFVDEYIKTLR